MTLVAFLAEVVAGAELLAVVNVLGDVIVAMKRMMVACLMVICIFNC